VVKKQPPPPSRGGGGVKNHKMKERSKQTNLSPMTPFALNPANIPDEWVSGQPPKQGESGRPPLLLSI